MRGSADVAPSTVASYDWPDNLVPFVAYSLSVTYRLTARSIVPVQTLSLTSGRTLLELSIRVPVPVAVL